MTIFLHGGNDHPQSRMSTFGRFVQAMNGMGNGRLALVIAEPSETAAQESFHAYRAIFEAVGVPSAQIMPLLVSPTTPLTPAMLETVQPAGLFVCGGVTPLYHQFLCTEPAWVVYLQEKAIPFGGTSAGAAIAASQAILGGWQTQRGQVTRQILFPGAGEGLELLTVRPGLGLVPFAVDVHASQMGTLTRLIHAVEMGLVGEGWGIDENTLLQVDEDKVQVYGLGHGYHVQRNHAGAVTITLYTARD